MKNHNSLYPFPNHLIIKTGFLEETVKYNLKLWLSGLTINFLKNISKKSDRMITRKCNIVQLLTSIFKHQLAYHTLYVHPLVNCFYSCNDIIVGIVTFLLLSLLTSKGYECWLAPFNLFLSLWFLGISIIRTTLILLWKKFTSFGSVLTRMPLSGLQISCST